LRQVIAHLPDELPVYVVGVGSNLIVRDGGMLGVVIRLAPRAFGETSADGDVVTAGAAALDKRVAETAASTNIGGMEFLFGIPGTIGGALRMNAGANGRETKDVLIEATGIGRDGAKHIFTNADMKFVYRNSGVDAAIIFTSAKFRGAIAAPIRYTCTDSPLGRMLIAATEKGICTIQFADSDDELRLRVGRQ
jgi:UDP-N-acetylmuramate dehydrogenase